MSYASTAAAPAVVDKNVVITGGNDGIGYATSAALARLGWRVLIVTRNQERAESAVARLKAETGNSRIEYVLADLSRQSSVRAASEELHRRVDRIDVLINNAGGTFSTFEKTEDGIERTIALNHIAYFLLTGLVLDLLKRAPGSRIINVSSASHRDPRAVDLDSYTEDKGHFILSAYGQSKLANVLFTVELAEKMKGTGITVNAVHPGTINTAIGTKDTMSRFHALAWKLSTKVRSKPLEEGARTSVYLATSDDVKGVTGKYWACMSRILNIRYPVPRVEKPHRDVADAALRARFWTLSEKLSHFTYPN
jgi:NAD(P)-dependent dehydrogenase (short-subunit alcohol dehydrogenase family)